MRIGCFQSCVCATSCYEFAKQALAATIIKLNEISCDPEAFQKTYIIALTIIREINFHCYTPYFPHAVHLLDTAAPAFDFYGIWRLPRLFFHPYTVDRFDEYAILNQLEVIFCDNWHLGVEDDEGLNRDPAVREFAKEQLTAFLKKMEEQDLDFRSAEEVRTTLHNWFEKILEVDPEEDFDPHNINLRDLEIVLKKKSLIETIITYIFIVVDVICVPDFLQGWELIDLAPYASQMGRLPFLSWVPNQRLDDWVWGVACAGHFLQSLRAGHALWSGTLTCDEAKDAKWLMAASIAECLYSLSNIQKRSLRLINCFALIAKSLGLIVFLVSSKPTFFNDD